MSPVARAEKLRGSQPLEELGARGIERVARNPDCLRLKALTIVGVSPAKAAQDILNRDDAEAQSPFALVLDQKFERHVLQNGAANLFALYVDQQHLSPAESRIVSVEELAPGTTAIQRNRRETQTRRLIALKLARDPSAPNLILKPRLLLDYGGAPHAIEPDYLVARDDEPFYRVGVLKSYADRGGKTDPADLRAACRQAAVGVAALRQLAAGLGAASALAAPRCDLILKVTGFFLPTLQRMAIVGEVDSVERALADAPASLDEIEALVPAWASLSDPAALVAIPSRYHSSCREHCALWTHCREQAIATGNPAGRARQRISSASRLDRPRDRADEERAGHHPKDRGRGSCPGRAGAGLSHAFGGRQWLMPLSLSRGLPRSTRSARSATPRTVRS